MGNCLSSKSADAAAAPLRESGGSATTASKGSHENKLEMVFKVKQRGNVFTQGIDVAAKHTPKVIKKTATQMEGISKYFKYI